MVVSVLALSSRVRNRRVRVALKVTQCFSTRSIESCEESLRLANPEDSLTGVSVLALSSRVRNHRSEDGFHIRARVSVLALSSRVRNPVAIILLVLSGKFQYSLYRVV